jgi:hypothetical protein
MRQQRRGWSDLGDLAIDDLDQPVLEIERRRIVAQQASADRLAAGGSRQKNSPKV